MKPAFQYVDRQLAIARAFARAETDRIVADCRHSIKTDRDCRNVAVGGFLIFYAVGTFATWLIICVL